MLDLRLDDDRGKSKAGGAPCQDARAPYARTSVCVGGHERIEQFAQSASGPKAPGPGGKGHVGAVSVRGRDVGLGECCGMHSDGVHTSRSSTNGRRSVLIMAVHQVPSLSQEKYEEVVRRLTGGKSRLESLSDLPFDGLLVHMAGQGKNGFCIVDIFESEEAVARFNEAMASIPREAGIQEPPEFFPAHTFIAT